MADKTLIEWDKTGERYFETGISRGTLYVAENQWYGKPIAWNGLVSVSENPEGAEENAIYADNIKYLSLRSVEEFKASIEAYTYPDEFGVCDGSYTPESVANGALKIGQQSRKSFAFCYTTKKGSDTNPDGDDIIHIVYGATASPTSKSYETINDSPDAATFSWDITTVPVSMKEFGEGIKPSAHLEIDTSKLSAAAKKAVEEALFAVDGTFPTLAELKAALATA